MRGLKQARWAQTPPTPSVSSPAYLEGREAKACGPASGTKVEGSGRKAKEHSSSYHSPCACCHRWGLRGQHCPLPMRRASRDLARAVSSPLAHPWPTHRLWGCQEGAGQSVDDAVEGHDVPHNDMANHNCSWDLWGDQVRPSG